MAETKTKPTGASVEAYLASRASPEQLADCKAIMAMCKRVTKQQPKMWGPSIVGFSSYTYRYESTGWVSPLCTSGAWRTSMSRSWRHSLPGRSPTSDAGIRTPATPNDPFKRTAGSCFRVSSHVTSGANRRVPC